MPDGAHRVGPLLGLALGASLVAGGCVLGPASLDGPLAVQMTITPTPTGVDVDAPTWYAKRSDVYLCPEDPPPLPEPGPDRIGWTPGGDCHAFPTVEGGDGLALSLPFDAIDGTEQPIFAAAPDWYLLIVAIEPDGRASSAVRSRFGRPDGFTT